MIKIDNLTKQFGRFTAVDGLSFTVAPGEVLGFLGPNGAGKSTTMKMITGFLAPTSGQVTVFGKDAVEFALQTKSVMGYLPEGAPSYGDMTPSQFLKFVGQVRGLKGAGLKQRLAQVTEILHLEKVSQQPIDTLSKGFKRRVGLAQAIIHDPQVLILDEPTDGLDPNQKQEVRNLIANLAQDKIVIVSTHILEEVSAVCSRAIIIAGGKILADGSPAELQARSRYHGAVRLQLEGDLDPTAKLQALEQVSAVEKEGSAWVVFPQANQNLYLAVHGLIAEQGWPVQEFSMEQGRLDEVFRAITQEAA